MGQLETRNLPDRATTGTIVRDIQVRVLMQHDGVEVIASPLDPEIVMITDREARVVAEVELVRPVIWLWHDLPETVCDAMAGRPLSDVIDLAGILQRPAMKIRYGENQSPMTMVRLWALPKLAI